MAEAKPAFGEVTEPDRMTGDDTVAAKGIEIAVNEDTTQYTEHARETDQRVVPTEQSGEEHQTAAWWWHPRKVEWEEMIWK